MSTEPEASVEDILASIRKIIAEDDAREAGQLDKSAAEETPPATEPVTPSDFQARKEAPPLPKSNGDVLTLTRMVREDGSIQDINDAPIAAQLDHSQTNEFDDGLIDPDAAQSVTVSFASLEAAVADQLGEDAGSDQVEAIARPMIKDWLDANLPSLVERVVREEVERLARRR